MSTSIHSPLFFLVVLLCTPSACSQSSCTRGCDVAYASYYLNVSLLANLTYIASVFSQSVSQIQQVNPGIDNPDLLIAGTYINVSFSCDCLSGGSFLGHYFDYTVDGYYSIANDAYVGLNTASNVIRVAVNCSCGDAAVSKDYGLFATYPLKDGDNLSSVASAFKFSDTGLLQEYNPGVDFASGKGIVFVPTTDANGRYPPFQSSTGGSSSTVGRGTAIAGICTALFVVLVLAACIYYKFYVRIKAKKASMIQLHVLSQSSNELVSQLSSGLVLGNVNTEKSINFTYEELSMATDGFSLTNKIGEGGFAAVYYAELRGQRAAVKKMNKDASKQFLAELKVLTHVHHLNLVRLIGYCIKENLFLVYEYIDNGNLSQHLRGSGVDPLPWSVRLQIALDSARGLEYIHEHTVPVYVHRDIKSANILIDRNFRAKVADFGLTKLIEAGNVSLPTQLVGTFGYMPPEYQYGKVSPKVDVFAFGVVLYELISAKEAIVMTEFSAEIKGLVSMFEDALNEPDPVEPLKKLVDTSLGDNYPIDSVFKLAQLAKSCTEEDPSKRPTMQTVAITLMALSSSLGDWDMGHFNGNQTLVNIMSGR